MGTLQISFEPNSAQTGEAAVPLQVLDSNLEILPSPLLDLDPSRPVTIKVPTGDYLIRAPLPSGELLSKQVKVEGDETVKVRLSPRLQSPREDLSWGYYLKTPQRMAVTTRRMESTPRLVPRLSVWELQFGARWKERNDLTLDLREAREDEGDPHSLGWLSVQTEDNQLWLRLTWDKRKAKFVALPPRHQVMVNLFQDDDPDQATDPVNVVVNAGNPRAEAVLGFLSRGDFQNARKIAERLGDDAKRLLQEKYADVASAAIGGYFLLQAGDLNFSHDWTKNLDEDFTFFSDGAVIRGWHCLRGDKADFEGARLRFLEAVDRGLPTFTQGLRLLHDGLNLFMSRAWDQRRTDIPVEEALARIKPYMTASDWTTPTTTFFGADPHVPRRIM